MSLSQADLLLQVEGNLIYAFFFGIKQTRRALIEGVKEVLAQYGVQRRGGDRQPIEGKENLHQGKVGEQVYGLLCLPLTIFFRVLWLRKQSECFC